MWVIHLDSHLPQLFLRMLTGERWIGVGCHRDLAKKEGVIPGSEELCLLNNLTQ